MRWQILPEQVGCRQSGQEPVDARWQAVQDILPGTGGLSVIRTGAY